MMFSPLGVRPRFSAPSLFGLAAVVFLVWEVSLLLHPERLSDDTNAALRCAGCTDVLCGRESRLGRQITSGQETCAGRS